MTKRLYLMRHGQTLFNEQKKIQGWCDSPLTELGKEQARAARRYFEENGMDVDGMSDEELEEASEVFSLPGGGYLIVEG